ncbi:MAG: hypothetical protein DIJKHBIC_04480 [Thermoanaerobaculia bacterium]|nr:hypothetical protein [Thermoanaerobaculia bacterium]
MISGAHAGLAQAVRRLSKSPPYGLSTATSTGTSRGRQRGLHDFGPPRSAPLVQRKGTKTTCPAALARTGEKKAAAAIRAGKTGKFILDFLQKAMARNPVSLHSPVVSLLPQGGARSTLAHRALVGVLAFEARRGHAAFSASRPALIDECRLTRLAAGSDNRASPMFEDRAGRNAGFPGNPWVLPSRREPRWLHAIEPWARLRTETGPFLDGEPCRDAGSHPFLTDAGLPDLARKAHAMRLPLEKRLLAHSILLAASILCGAPFAGRALATSAKDVKGSSDHPLFPVRMPGYAISHYKAEEFASYTFWVGKSTRSPVEGRKTLIHYRRSKETPHPGGLAILRNYEIAIQNAGGRTVFSSNDLRTLRLTTSSGEAWAEIKASTSTSGPVYFVTIVEKKAMEQVITADAILDKLAKEGSIALHILFDTGKAVIKPESAPILDQIVVALKKDPALAVSVEGHTDNTGTLEGNRVLSQDRARAVVTALVERGVRAERLSSAGHGQEKPVAGNSTEEGRAANRRVVLVKKKAQ